MDTDDLKARLLHGEGQDWDLPYATRKEAHDTIAILEAQLAEARGEVDAIVALLATAREALCEYACHAGEAAPCIRKCHPMECGLAAGDAIMAIDLAIAARAYREGEA